MTAVPSGESLPKLIDVEEFFADPVFSGASISPDGTRIAYLAPKYGRTNVWVRGIDEEHEDAVCVTHNSRRGIKTYHWTDDPRWLLYMQDTDGNEDWHLYRVDLDAPEEPAVDLTPMPGCPPRGDHRPHLGQRHLAEPGPRPEVVEHGRDPRKGTRAGQLGRRRGEQRGDPDRRVLLRSQCRHSRHDPFLAS